MYMTSFKKFHLASLPLFGIALILFAFSNDGLAQDKNSRRTRAQKLTNITGDESFGDSQSGWDKTYARKEFVFGKEPSAFLRKHVEKLPKGLALDIAMGEGRHAIYLAKKGFAVEGVDLSAVGLRKAQKFAAANGVKIETINADLNKFVIKPARYTVILNFYYLNRSLFPKIKQGLARGGVVVFETNTTEQLKNAGSKTLEKEYLLEPNELKNAFSDFEILDYSETNDGKNAIASLIARKR